MLGEAREQRKNIRGRDVLLFSETKPNYVIIFRSLTIAVSNAALLYNISKEFPEADIELHNIITLS